MPTAEAPMPTDPILQLIDALADIVVEDYLREQAANDAAPAPARENPALPATGTRA